MFKQNFVICIVMLCLDVNQTTEATESEVAKLKSVFGMVNTSRRLVLTWDRVR